MSQRPIAEAMPTTATGGVIEAATNTPVAAPDTRLLLSDWTRFRAPDAPATIGRSAANPDTVLDRIICSVGTSRRKAKLSKRDVEPATASEAKYRMPEGTQILSSRLTHL
jgi:hypothetical protein